MRTCQKIHTRSAKTRSLYHVGESEVETIGSLDSIICLRRGLHWNQRILDEGLLSHNLLTDTAIFITHYAASIDLVSTTSTARHSTTQDALPAKYVAVAPDHTTPHTGHTPPQFAMITLIP